MMTGSNSWRSWDSVPRKERVSSLRGCRGLRAFLRVHSPPYGPEVALHIPLPPRPVSLALEEVSLSQALPSCTPSSLGPTGDYSAVNPLLLRILPTQLSWADPRVLLESSLIPHPPVLSITKSCHCLPNQGALSS